MRKVRYISTTWGNSISYLYLTTGRIYDVIRYIPGTHRYLDKVEISYDSYVLGSYLVYSYTGEVEFEDVTTEYRDLLINGILE